jgi:hypothetical protein
MSWDATDILEHMLGYATELSIVDHARGMAGYAAADLYSVRSPRLPLAPEVQDLGAYCPVPCRSPGG